MLLLKFILLHLTVITGVSNFSVNDSSVAVLILARGGSKGIPLKNLQQFGAKTLIRNSIEIAQSAGFLAITVSTDHPLIALEAVKSNASVFHRSAVTATDWAPSIWGAAEFIRSRPEVQVLVLMQATSPFVKPQNLKLALKKLSYPLEYDCVFSATKSYKFRWHYVNDILTQANFNANKRPRRQDWDGEYFETGSFYIARRQLIERGHFQNENCTIWEVSTTESLEIDTYYDLHMANVLLAADEMSLTTDIVTYEELEATDVISVELVPERKGLILKHCEYYVSSRRHGTTVSRRYNDFAQLYDVLTAKYPYRCISRLPPKRVVVGGGSDVFLQRRRLALHRWLTLVAQHPVLAHDADLRAFLCEISPKFDKPKHDEFILAGTHDDTIIESELEALEAAFTSNQEQLRLMQLGLARLSQVFERGESRCESERADIRELGAGLTALASPPGAARAPPAAAAAARWYRIQQALAAAAQLASRCEEERSECSSWGVALALEALAAHRALCARARLVPLRPARTLYCLRAISQESAVVRAYALAALEESVSALQSRSTALQRLAATWAELHEAARDQLRD